MHVLSQCRLGQAWLCTARQCCVCTPERTGKSSHHSMLQFLKEDPQGGGRPPPRPVRPCEEHARSKLQSQAAGA